MHRGALDDLDRLQAVAAASDGVIHTAFIHDFSNLAVSAQTDLRAIEALGAALEGSDRPLVITSGTAALPAGRVASERDEPDRASAGSHRIASEDAALALAARGVRSAVVRPAPTVHGEGDHGFVAALIGIARDTGVSAYVGDGANRWPAVHRLDAARLFRLALEAAPAGSILHAVAEEGVPTRDIAAAIGRHLDLPVVAAEREHFGWLGGFFGADIRASSALTRELLGWQPAHPGLIEDLDQGHYFEG